MLYNRTRAAMIFLPTVGSPAERLDFFDRDCILARPVATNRRVDCDEATRVAKSFERLDFFDRCCVLVRPFDPDRRVDSKGCSRKAHANLVNRARLFPHSSLRAAFKPPLFRLGFQHAGRKESLVLHVSSRRHKQSEYSGRRGCVSSASSFPASRNFFCLEQVVVFCRLSCAERSFRCFCASSWRSRSVLKKSASVVARDSALTVTVSTCFYSASAFSGAPLMAPLSVVSAAEASSHFCSQRRLASSCRSRAWVG